MSTERRIQITYDVITPESCEQGDYAESGFENEEGVLIAPDELDIEEHETELAAVAYLAAKEIRDRGGVEPSSSWFHPGIWYSTVDPDQDYGTGEDTCYSFHLDGFTEEEEKAIHDYLFPVVRR